MTEPEYSRIAVERAERMIESQEGAWRAMLVDLGIEPLMLWYEDVLTAPGRAIDAVAEYLEIEIDPSAAVKIPRIERQSQDGARTCARQHAGG